MADLSTVFNGGLEVDTEALSAPAGERKPLPMGDYKFQVVDSELRERDGKTFLTFKFEVVGGEHNGRWYWENYFVESSSEQQQRIGHENLMRLMQSCGLQSMTNTDQLCGRQFGATLKAGKPKKDGGFYVNMVGYTQVNQSAQGQPPQTSPDPAPAPSSDPFDMSADDGGWQSA